MSLKFHSYWFFYVHVHVWAVDIWWDLLSCTVTATLIALYLCLNLHKCCAWAYMCVGICSCCLHLYVEAVVPDLFTGTIFLLAAWPMFIPCDFLSAVCRCDMEGVCTRWQHPGDLSEEPLPFIHAAVWLRLRACVCVCSRERHGKTERQSTRLLKKMQHYTNDLSVFCLSSASNTVHNTQQSCKSMQRNNPIMFRQLLASHP